MRESQQCPKCDGKKLWRIESYTSHFDKRPIRMRVLPDAGNSMWKAKPVGVFEVWLCAACGFTEFYAQDFEGLQHNPGKGIYLVDRSGDQAGAYR